MPDIGDATGSASAAGGAEYIHHSYGFGLVDANAAVQSAVAWKNLPAGVDFAYFQAVNRLIPDDNSEGLESSIYIPEALIIEFIDIYFDAPDHAKVGDLSITLISPSGTRSVLSEVHNQVFGVFRYRNWRFGSIRHLGEPALGYWRLQVQDRRPENQGAWVSWKMVVHGYQESVASSK